MKNLIIIIGTILLGAFIVNSLVLGEGEHSLKTAASTVVSNGSDKIASEADSFTNFDIQGISGIS